MNIVRSCLLRINDKAKPQFEIEFTNKLYISDAIRLIEGADNTHPQPG